ncbi:MAG: DUF642 domain-containing protein [Paraglaciecola sp.]|nr:DUF642 domain-containing protein [Paraglaciecola sp.]
MTLLLKSLTTVMSNKLLNAVIIGSLLTFFSATSVNANLVVNGSFEVNATGPSIGGGNGWKYYAANNLSGWDGSNIELWGTLGIDSYEGGYHAELNAHGQRRKNGAWSISQTFETIAGQSYDLFFAYSARLGNANNSVESFSVAVDGLFHVLDDHVVGNWSTFSSSFIADDNTATLTFTSRSQNRWTYGNFIDDVRVSAVPEPTSFALLALGLIGLGATRKKAKA